MSKKLKTKVRDDIPDDIRDEILYKLSTKSLVRFTCVSKSWLSLIKSPTFISTHIKHSISAQKKNPLLLLCYCSVQNHTEHYWLYLDKEGYSYCNHYLMNKERYNHCIRFRFPFNNHYHNSLFSIVGTINGLVCLSNDTQTIIIWNPSINKSITLPKPSSTCFNRVSYGFGFDSRSNDYKLLRLAQRFFRVEVEDEEQEPDKDTLEAEIYSLNTNSWKRICAPRYEIKRDNRQVFVNGVMHMLAFRRLRNGEFHNLILGFNVGDEVFNKIALPQCLVDGYPLSLNAVVYKESIAAFGCLRSTLATQVWLMKEYGVVQSWTMFSWFDGIVNFIRFRKNGKCFWRIDERMVSFEPENGDVKRLGVNERYPFIDYFVESLELLGIENAQSVPTVENDAIGNAAGDALAANY